MMSIIYYVILIQLIHIMILINLCNNMYMTAVSIMEE